MNADNDQRMNALLKSLAKRRGRIKAGVVFPQLGSSHLLRM
jgi:hypothetical protein